VKNLGSSFVYLVIYFALWIFYVFFALLAKLIPIFSYPAGFLSRRLFWNLTLSLFISQYPPIFMAALINLYDIKFETAFQMASTALCFGLGTVLPFGLFVIMIAVFKFRKAGIIGSDEY
jgi:hypothetical protein